MSKKRILIVEDDESISKLVQYNLEKSGFECFTKLSAESAIEFLETKAVDLIILDIMLPGIDGLEACKQIKSDARFANIPVVMLTAKGEEIDRIVGFELGADDYMIKPFSPRELVLRIKAILKRGISASEQEDENLLRINDLVLDLSRHKVTIKNKEVKLTSMEFKLLVTLLKRKGRVQTRDCLLEDVWELDAEVTTRTVDTHVKRLRQKLGRYGKFIETVRGYGYRLNDGE